MRKLEDAELAGAEARDALAALVLSEVKASRSVNAPGPTKELKEVKETMQCSYSIHIVFT